MYNWKTLKQLNDSQTKDVKVPDKFKFSIDLLEMALEKLIELEQYQKLQIQEAKTHD
jgi:hypothetical protein